MKISRIQTFDSMRFQVRFPDGTNVNLSLSRTRSGVSGKGLIESQMREIGAWYFRIIEDKSHKDYSAAFDVVEAFLNTCKTLDDVVAGPKTSPMTATIARLATELKAKVASVATSGKYDHLYTPGMSAKEKQAIRARARREA